MQLGLLRQEIRKKHKKGKSYRLVGVDYGINKTTAWRIERGYRPGKKVSAILQLEPDPTLKYTRTRRERLDELAQRWGFDNWSNFETWQLRSNK